MHSSATDDGFREIQLSGKQIVFLFIVATVVSAVIFLSGVFVGQGVTSGGGGSAAAARSASDGETREVLSNIPAERYVEDATTAEASGTSPAPTPEELSYYSRLEGSEPPEETLELPVPVSEAAEVASPPTPVPTLAAAPPASAPAASVSAPRAESEPPAARETVARAPAALTPPPPAAEAAPPPVRPTTAPSTSSQGSGYAVQVTALQAKEEAYSIAGRLIEKGYQAYVEEWASGASAPIYRVRVGRGLTSREADLLAARLEREESFDPWITTR